ncbi:MAG TPA: hypothetical protein VM049_07815 [Gaiellaceae bacterium]|nr:hypothetical protein [Gaiellaceae bacterium]
MSDQKRDQQDDQQAQQDANEDLQLKDEDADQVRGGLIQKQSSDLSIKK